VKPEPDELMLVSVGEEHFSLSLFPLENLIFSCLYFISPEHVAEITNPSMPEAKKGKSSRGP